MKKLLILTQTIDERDQVLGFFISWVNKFAGQFSKVTVLCLNKGEYSLPSNVEVIGMGKSEGLSKAGQRWNFFRTIIGRRKDYDAVLVHMNPIYVVAGGIIWKVLGKKIALWYTHKSVTWKLRLAVHGADIIFTASPESFRLKSKKVIVTGHGIDTEMFSPASAHIEQGPARILTVGRIAQVKNYEVLLQAAQLLRENNFKFSLDIVGEPLLPADRKYLERLQHMSVFLGLEKNTVFAGKKSQTELPDVYRSHDLFVHMSKTGSLDKSLLEAMACGIRVVSSNDAAKAFLPAEAIFDENSPEQLSETIRRIMAASTDPKLRQYVVENHNLDSLIKKISSIIS